MPSSLPPELLREIIEAAIPHSFHSSTYETRQKTLCSLSLASKLFRAIAQPLLLEIIEFDELSRHDPFAAESGGGGGGGGEQRQDILCKQAVIDNKYYETSQNLTQRLSSVTSLTFWRGIPDSLELQSLNHLTSLHLSSSDWELPRTFTLPHLHSLTPRWVGQYMSSALLDPAVLPNLRNLVLAELNIRSFSTSSIDRLLPQLETIQCVTSSPRRRITL
ncbi:uncharacterized protein JCM6883_002118 [Sporobolomyces salmoneus]|uniref:uncharacterized protein n=1 Tax=Sporobolomyces salmoneus TaxID=183962 RepID=UPI0031756198